MSEDVRVLAAPEAVYLAAAEEIQNLIAAAATFSFALSGGSTPRPLYSMLSDPAKPFAKAVPWERVHFFWTDERQVPPDHPSSNYRIAFENLISKIPAAAENVHRIRSEFPDPEKAAIDHEVEIRRHFGLGSAGYPRFDLVLLGIGREGHVASIFPNSPALAHGDRLVAAPWVEELGARRFTVTMDVLNHAARILVLVVGKEKSSILHAALRGPRRPDLIPAQAVDPENGSVTWLVDAAAAEAL